MPNIPCEIRSSCACDESPFANLSAEAPDLPTYFSIGFQAPSSPLGVEWMSKGCMFICTSTVSQEAADLCAAREGLLCVTSGWTSGVGGLTPSGPVPPVQATQGASPVRQFRNTEQTCGIRCADGLTFFFTVPAGVFAGVNQAAADTAANSYACRQAQLRRVCLGTLKTPTCPGLPYTGTITASGKFLATGTQTDLWELAAGTLPPGLTFHGGNLTGGQATITGTPTTIGSYFFVVQVTDPKGDAMAKGYTLVVAGITNALPDAKAGEAYSAQLQTVGFSVPGFSISSGTLPDGLTLSSGGLISGTPTTGGTSTVVLNIAETGRPGGFQCSQSVTLTVTAGFTWNILWPTPSISESVGGTVAYTYTPNSFTIDTNAGATLFGGGSYASQESGHPRPRQTALYTGPAVNANLHLDMSDPAWVDGDNANFFRIFIYQDGNQLLSFVNDVNPPGVYDLPLAIAEGVASLIEIDIVQESSSGFGLVPLTGAHLITTGTFT